MIRSFSSREFINTFLNGTKKGKALDESIVKAANEVIDSIRVRGEEALKEYVEKFDGVVPEEWEVTSKEREEAWNQVPESLILSLKKAADNIKGFHSKQLQQSRMMEVSSDIMTGQLFRPLKSVGIYVPGGTACYPSTVLMNAIPAVLAGVEEVVMVTPARNAVQIAPILSVAADIAGVHKILKIGGIQAIAALAYGTEKINAVHKIVGPGNAYVAAAKSIVYGDVGIDMIAGPSEVVIIADDSANPCFIAADLIAQAEHDTNARTFLFSISENIIQETRLELEKQCAVLPRREIAEKSLKLQSAAVKVATIDEAFYLSNQLAPEHLEIQLDHPLEYLGKVQNAGSVFLGHHTPEALGDYFAGPNHVLPTNNTARFSSGLSVDDFVKKTTYIYYSKQALEKAAPHVMNLAESEQLDGHARAVGIRMKQHTERGM
ncbi:histidinol dehydrogenase [Heyndrickxia acidicola]|uniref:Histidinol dehydrogenase n=1 Tax=Heyndrickxia acidicola TaxID=209389 RepID=A0ABU6MB16_9BACI|nr:histidinol dehydrogenase [Heyndrickxia acidicola]MED1201603.1 histidinol dehydrogenase [Heyndrickxia acidicola]